MNYSKEPAFSTHLRRPNLQKFKHQLLALHEAKCAYCGINLSSGYTLIDSYMPFRSIEDPENIHNYVLACAQCEFIKGAREPISPDGKVLILHPYSENYRTEIQFNEDGIAEGKTEAGASTIQILQLNRSELVSYRKDHIADFIAKLNDGISAHDVYRYSIEQIKDLLQIEIPSADLQQHFHRMIYANVISSMEAYLSKTLITIVMNDETYFWEFVKRFDWNKEKVNIENIKESYNNMTIKVQTKLSEILYHNLPKVKALYQKVLNIDILQNHEDMKFLCRAVDIRHDLVHRNGRKNSGSKVDEYHSISVSMINDLVTHVDNLIHEIESSFSK